VLTREVKPGDVRQSAASSVCGGGGQTNNARPAYALGTGGRGNTWGSSAVRAAVRPGTTCEAPVCGGVGVGGFVGGCNEGLLCSAHHSTSQSCLLQSVHRAKNSLQYPPAVSLAWPLLLLLLLLGGQWLRLSVSTPTAPSASRPTTCQGHRAGQDRAEHSTAQGSTAQHKAQGSTARHGKSPPAKGPCKRASAHS
jgi:hypothetical protein